MKKRPVAELLAGTVRTIPGETATVKRPGPLGRHCPNCGAAVGRPCRTPGGAERSPHAARTNATQPDDEQRAAEERIRARSAAYLARRTDTAIPDAEIIEDAS
jgi:hypothetical protein